MTKSFKKSSSLKRFGGLLKPRQLAFAAFLLFFAVTILAWFYTRQKIEKESRAIFEDQVNQTTRLIDLHIQDYIDTLYDLRGLFRVSGDISLEQWNRYIQSLDLERRLPGIVDVTFARTISGKEKKNFETHIQQIYHNKTLTVHPAGNREKYFPTLYATSFQKENTRKLGFDLGGDLVRLSALDRAIASGKAAATGKLTLQITQKPGFAIRIPVFKNDLPRGTGDEKRAALLGFISFSLSVDNMMGSIFEENNSREVDFEIYDNGPVEKEPSRNLNLDSARFFYDRDGVLHMSDPLYQRRYQKTVFLGVAGEEWLIYFSTPSDFNTGLEARFPLFILLSGTIISFLVFGMTWSAANSQARAEELAMKMTVELKESEGKFRSISQTARDAIISTDLSGKVVYVNDEAVRLSGYSSEEIVGKYYDILISERLRGSRAIILEKHLFTKKARRSGKVIETTAMRKDQTEFPVELSLGRWKIAGQSFFTAIARDITNRKKSEKVIKEKNSFVQLLYIITVAANESASLEEALQICVDAVCQHTGWPMGHVYLTKNDNGGNVMIPSNIWHFDNPLQFTGFRRMTENTILRPGEGLPGKVLEDRAPLWMVLPLPLNQFPRGLSAEASGIKTCFAFPLLVEQEVVAVLEFFSREKVSPDESVLEAMTHIGTQLGRIVERKRAKERMSFMATHDPLTQIPNRTIFSDRLANAIANAKRSLKSVAVVFIDLDRFKRINDTLGHTLGDVAIQAVAQRLKSNVRISDTVSRWGGDEFTLIFENLARVKDARKLCQKIVEGLAKPFDVGGHECFITASVGVSLFPHDGETEEILLRHADTAMYRAKERGRNNFQFFSQEMSSDSSDKLVLENQLRHAIDRKEFVLYYQPVLDCQTGRITGAEALIRWKHPVLGIIPPGTFIPLAEETGLIIPMSEWVIQTACAQNKAWQETGLPPIRVATNVTALYFQLPGMVEKIRNILKETDLAPQYLELELTESVLMHQKEETIINLNKLHDMGIDISIDDFGTGYSSLSYLKRFPINSLKIDRSFVMEVTTNPDDAAIAWAIIAMAKSLKLKVIAEAVETADQLAFLKSHACDEFQGFLFSPAVPPEAFINLVKANNASVFL